MFIAEMFWFGCQLNKVAVPLALSATLVVLAQMLGLLGLMLSVGSGFTTTVAEVLAVQELAAVTVTL